MGKNKKQAGREQTTERERRVERDIDGFRDLINATKAISGCDASGTSPKINLPSRCGLTYAQYTIMVLKERLHPFRTLPRCIAKASGKM